MKLHLLFDGDGPRIPLDGEPAEGASLEALGPLVDRLRVAQAALRAVSIDELIGLCDAAAMRWTRPDSPLADVIRRYDLGFLPLWMRRSNLERLVARSLHGRPECLDRFVRLDPADPMLVRAQPRGLAVHWLAGNVPVLGLLSLLLSALCKNANLLKVSHVGAGLLPQLLEGFREVSCRNAVGQTVEGKLLLDAVAVVYADRTDVEAARALSTAADVRVAWGGREAVEAVMGLPRRLGTEDVVFGPKLSLAIVGAECLADEKSAGRIATALARDASAFDQHGCNSPHTVFVERGGAVSPAAFAGLVAEAMKTVCRQFPPGPIDPASAMNVLATRTEYDMRGEAYYGHGAEWTVVYAEQDRGLAEPCYWRTLFLRPVDDVFDAVPYCSEQTQTVGLAVEGRRLELAEALTARGAARCPGLGTMRMFDSPWDGMFPVDRFVRWTSTYAPAS